MNALSESSKFTLMIGYVTGCPIWAPSWSELYPYVAENGRLNEAGRAIVEAMPRDADGRFL